MVQRKVQFYYQLAETNEFKNQAGSERDIEICDLNLSDAQYEIPLSKLNWSVCCGQKNRLSAYEGIEYSSTKLRSKSEIGCSYQLHI